MRWLLIMLSMLYIIIDKNNSNFKSVNVNIFVKVFALAVKWFYFSTDNTIALCRSDAHMAWNNEKRPWTLHNNN